MDRLIEGYRRFRARRWPEQRRIYAALAEAQAPRFLVIACCDSRVDPATIFDAAPGEIFVIRNVANLVPPYEEGFGLHGTSAAIEFAVRRLKVGTILVMGHARCGGIAAALEPHGNPGSTFLDGWISLIDHAAREQARAQDDPHTALERESVRLSIGRLLTFPFIAEAVEKGELSLEGARFGIADGRLELLDKETGLFRDIA